MSLVINICKTVNLCSLLLNEMTAVDNMNIICFEKVKENKYNISLCCQKKVFGEKLDTLSDILTCLCKVP